jgi:hypothetical protein
MLIIICQEIQLHTINYVFYSGPAETDKFIMINYMGLFSGLRNRCSAFRAIQLAVLFLRIKLFEKCVIAVFICAHHQDHMYRHHLIYFLPYFCQIIVQMNSQMNIALT